MSGVSEADVGFLLTAFLALSTLILAVATVVLAIATIYLWLTTHKSIKAQIWSANLPVLIAQVEFATTTVNSQPIKLIGFKNAGKGPALPTWIQYSVDDFTRRYPLGKELTPAGTSLGYPPSTLDSFAREFANNQGLEHVQTFNDLVSEHRKKVPVRMQCSIRYKDIFGNEYETLFKIGPHSSKTVPGTWKILRPGDFAHVENLFRGRVARFFTGICAPPT